MPSAPPVCSGATAPPGWPVGQPARAVGYASGWLAEEAQALGMGWQGVAAIGAHHPQTWLAAIDAALHAPATPFSTYGQQVLGQSYAQWLLAALNSGR